MIRTVIFLITLCFLLPHNYISAQNGGVKITGKVVDADSGDPVVGANVIIEKKGETEEEKENEKKKNDRGGLENLITISKHDEYRSGIDRRGCPQATAKSPSKRFI